MSTVMDLSEEEIRDRGLYALERELGLVGMIRFLQLVDPGAGNGADERHEWMDRLTLGDIRSRLDARRAAGLGTTGN